MLLQGILSLGKAAGQQAVGVELLAQITGKNHHAIIGGGTVVVVEIADNIQHSLHILRHRVAFRHDTFKDLCYRGIEILVAEAALVGCAVPVEDLALVVIVQVKGTQGVFVGVHQILGAAAETPYAHAKGITGFFSCAYDSLVKESIGIFFGREHTHHAGAALFFSQKTAIAVVLQIIAHRVEGDKGLQQAALIGQLFQLLCCFLCQTKA